MKIRKISKCLLACLMALLMMTSFLPFGVVNEYFSMTVHAVNLPASVSENGIAFIKAREGFRATAYWDYAQYSIGYGSKCNKNQYPNGITESEADKLLREKLAATYEPAVRKFLTNNNVSVSQNQYDALVSFTYNLGTGCWNANTNFATIRKCVKEQWTSESKIREAFGLYVRSGGSVNQGLVNRRKLEAELYISGISDDESDLRYTMSAFQQDDPRWGSHKFGSSNMAYCACGPVSLVNAIYALNGVFMYPTEVADWSMKNGGYCFCSECKGTKRDFFGNYANANGEKYGFRMVKQTYTFSSLKPYLEQGCTAVMGVQGHFVAVVAYKDGKYRVLDCAAGDSYSLGTTRQTHAAGDWMAEDDFTGKMKKGSAGFFIFQAVGSPDPTPDPTPVIKQPGVYEISASKLNVRSGPGTKHDKLGQLSKGNEVEVTEISGNWGKIKYSNKDAWISLSYAFYVRALETVRKPDAPALTLNTSSDAALNAINTVSWNAVEHAESYKVQVLNESGSAIVSQEGITGTSTSFTIPDAGIYTVQITAVNKKYTSDTSVLSQKITVHPDVTVLFVNDDGSELDRQVVSYGGTASTPAPPSKKGFTFCGWDGSYSNVTSDVTITAQYTRNKYNVNFYDANGKTLDSNRVYYEDAATAPADPVLEGYVFKGWDKDFSYVEDNMDIYPIFSWENEDLPILISDISAVRDAEGYSVSYKLANMPGKSTSCRLVVSLKTAEGKLITYTESSAYYLREEEALSDTIYVPSQEVASVVEINAVQKFTAVVPIAVNQSTGVTGSAYTNWSTEEPPEDAQQVETATEYRYRTKTYTTSDVMLPSPWTYESETSGYGDWGGWSEWTTNYVASSDTREVQPEVRQGAPESYVMCSYRTRGASSSGDVHVQYRNYSIGGNYSAYGCSSSFGEYINFGSESDVWTVSADVVNNARVIAPGALGEGFRDDDSCTNVSYYHGFDGYNKTNMNGYVLHDGVHEMIWFIKSTNYSQQTWYRYRDRTPKTTYTYSQLSEYSEWSTTPVTETDTTLVETRTVYRYIPSDASTIENTEGVARTVSGTVDPQYAGKQALLFVYKIDEAADYTNEAVAQTVIGEDGSYEFNFKLREEPTSEIGEDGKKPTGDFTVTLGIEGNSSVIYLDPILAPVPEYTVQFVNYDGALLSEITVSKGDTAEIPTEIPERRGYTFVGWDYSPSNIQSNMVLTAQYIKNTYSIAFIDWQSQTAVMQQYKYGDPILPPDVTRPEGYAFVGWDQMLDGVTTVTDNMVMTAVYEPILCEVSFVDYDGNVIDTQTVTYGSAVIQPEPLADDEVHDFIQWSTGVNYNCITSSVIVYPEFCYYETTEMPAASLETGVYDTAQTLELTAPEGASIYYTLDGSDPSLDGILYEKPIELTKSCVLNCYAAAENRNDSEVLTAYYAVNTGEAQTEYMGYDALPDYVQENAALYNVTSAVGYRYMQELEITSKSQMESLTADGWEIAEESWSEWSEWSTNISGTADLVIEENSKDAEPVEMPFYQYSHWKYYDEETDAYVYTYEELEGITGEWETIDCPEKLPVDAFVDSVSSYQYNGQKWFNQTSITKTVVPEEKLYQYRYKIMTMTKLSEWVETVPEGKEAVETGEVFCYDEPNKYILTIQYDGTELYQSLTNADEAIRIDTEQFEMDGFDLTGFTDESGNTWDIENDVVTESITLTALYESKQYTVVFKDADGTVLDAQTVNCYSSAVSPSVEDMNEGMVFVGWSDDAYLNVTTDTEVTAQYIPIEDVSRVTLSRNQVQLSAGSIAQVNAQIEQVDEDAAELVWKSMDPEVAEVDDSGSITACASGETDIVVTELSTGAMALCTVTVSPNPEAELCLLGTSGLTVSEDDTLLGVREDANSVAQIAAKFTNNTLSVTDAEGNVLEETDIAGTDAVISLIDAEGNVLDAVTIVMKGDVDGNGAISVVDAVRTLRYIVGTAELTEAQVSAADVTDDGHVGTMDADQIGRYLLQQGPFYESVHN